MFRLSNSGIWISFLLFSELISHIEIDFDFETTAIYPLNTDTQWYASPNIRWLFSGSFYGSLKLMAEIETSNLHKMFFDQMLSYTIHVFSLQYFHPLLWSQFIIHPSLIIRFISDTAIHLYYILILTSPLYLVFLH